MYMSAKAVQALPEFKLLIAFDNGEQRVFDVSPYLDHGIFHELRNPTIFNSVRINFDSVEWANGADLCPEVLYRESVPLKDGPETLKVEKQQQK